MTDLVTLAEAKLYCRYDGDDEDATFAILIGAASESVRQIADNWDGTGEVSKRLKLAVLARIAEAFDNREQVPSAKNELSMLYSLRDVQI